MSVELRGTPLRPSTRWSALLALLALPLMMSSVGCGEETEQTVFKAPASKKPAGAAGKPKASAAPVVSPTANMPPLPMREFQESDFADSDQSRDPFRTYESVFAKVKSRNEKQRVVLIERYALEELKLVGVVTRGAPRALLSDPTGLGWIVQVGDYIGKEEVVHAGGPSSSDVAVNWRVDRIRDGDIVLIREDPSHPEIPPSTRVIALRPAEGDAARTTAIR